MNWSDLVLQNGKKNFGKKTFFKIGYKTDERGGAQLNLSYVQSVSDKKPVESEYVNGDFLFCCLT